VTIQGAGVRPWTFAEGIALTETPTVNSEAFCSDIAVKYRLALGIIAILSCIAYFSLTAVIEAETSSATAINLSGRQRMLSQRIVLLSRELLAAKESSGFEATRSKLIDAIQLMDKTHHALIHGDDSLGIPAPSTSAIQEIYFSPPYEVDRRTHTFLQKARAFASGTEQTLTPDDLDLVFLSSTAPELLQLLDEAVSRYERDSYEKVNNILLMERGILAFTLLTLLLLAHFIFRPMVVQLKKRAHTLLQNKRQFHEILSSMGEGLIVTDKSLVITVANPSTARLLGWNKHQILGAQLADIISGPPQDSSPAFSSIVQVSQSELHGEHIFTHRDGSRFPVSYAITQLLEEDEITGHVITFKDISERKQHEAQIKHLAYHDTLTNLPNRRLFDDRLLLELAHAKRNNRTIAVMFLDLDDFKIINDTLGHEIGDKVLQVAAQRIQATIRESDTVARMGGDEFVLLVSSLESKEDSTRVAEKIIDSLKQPIEIEGHYLTVSSSIGISIYPHDADTDSTLIAKADCAMYSVKKLGRNGFALCSEMRAEKSCPLTCKYH
jgi:diguanylate cyclase (GGDEF)-like protein/PAS domain S-box-containing protein